MKERRAKFYDVADRKASSRRNSDRSSIPNLVHAVSVLRESQILVRHGNNHGREERRFAKVINVPLDLVRSG